MARKRECPSTRKSTKIQNKSNNHLPTKKISEKAKSVFSVQSVFKFLSIAEGRWTLLLTDIFILCFSLIYSFRVAIVSPAFGVDTNQKKKHGYHGLDTDWSFTDLFLILFGSMMFGFCYGFIWICEC